MKRLQLGLLLLPLIASCRREQPPPVAPLTAREQDRKDLVRSPKSAREPENAARKLNLLLLTDKARIRVGEAFRYRLEMRNAGREPLLFKETAPSFIKDGSLCGDTAFRFHATPPGGKERLLECRPKAAGVQASTAPAAIPESELDLTLPPGEYLLTRGSGAAAGFRELRTSFVFDTPGVYRLKAVHAPEGGPRSVSNTVALEVVP